MLIGCLKDGYRDDRGKVGVSRWVKGDAVLPFRPYLQGTVLQTAIGAAYIRARLHAVSAYPVIDRSQGSLWRLPNAFPHFWPLAFCGFTAWRPSKRRPWKYFDFLAPVTTQKCIWSVATVSMKWLNELNWHRFLWVSMIFPEPCLFHTVFFWVHLR